MSLVTRPGGAQKKSPRKKPNNSTLSVAERSRTHKNSFSGSMSRGIQRAKSMLPGTAEAQTRLRPRDLEEKTADTVHLVRSTTGVAIRGLTRSTRNADEPEDGHQAINVMSKSVYPWSCQTDSETTYPSADWDRMSLTQRVIDDFTSETAIPRISDETEASVSYVSPAKPRRTD